MRIPMNILYRAVFFMKIKKWEIALLAGFIAAAIFAAPFSVQAGIADKLIRLHVVANSDSGEDQALKLKVRDEVLAASEGYETVTDELIDIIQARAQNCVYANGYDYDVRVSRGEMWFDTREYDGFSLAAGTYDALQVRIGEGAGKNWWCVIFPPLCAAVSQQELESTAAAAGLTGKEIAFISKEGNVSFLGFKLVELWGRVLKGLEKRK